VPGVATTCDICLLGGFCVVVDGNAVPGDAWRHRRAAELVKLLALAPGHRLHREQVMDTLWPDLPVEAAAANLRKAVHFARRALGWEGSIGTDAGMLTLAPAAGVNSDVERFETAAGEALRAGDERSCTAAAELYGGELLPEDRYAPWAEEPRERLHLRYLQVLKAGRMWERVLEMDGADEQAHRSLMQAALDTGDRRAAIRQFERLRERLRADLGVGPEPASVALYERALAMQGQEPPTAAERTRALLAWGLVHLNQGDLEEAERTAEEARALAIDAGLGREVGEASAILGLVASAQGRWNDLFRSEFIQSVRRTPALVPFVFDAHLCLAEFSLHSVEGCDAIVALARELLTVAEQAGSIQGQALATLLLGEVELLSGELEQAGEHLGRAVELHEQARAPSGQALSMERMAAVALARGQRWHADRLLQRALRLAAASRLAPHLLVRVHGAMIQAAAPDLPRSVAAVQRADAALAGRDLCPPCSMGFRVAATMALARAGDLQQARARLEAAERIAGMWQGGPWLAAIWEARGVLRRSEGDHAQAAALFKEAAERFAQANRPVDEARCRAAAAASA
jgi:DNA-binding SARP family transcriptional activator